MSLSALMTAMGRIAVATPESQIAVFHNGCEMFNTVFANTVHTQKLIAKGGPRFVGIFDSTMAKERVMRTLHDALDRAGAAELHSEAARLNAL